MENCVVCRMKKKLLSHPLPTTEMRYPRLLNHVYTLFIVAQNVEQHPKIFQQNHDIPPHPPPHIIDEINFFFTTRGVGVGELSKTSVKIKLY